MATLDLGLGGRLDSFDLSSTFAGTGPSAALQFDGTGDNRGYVRYAASANADATAMGQTAAGAKARGIISGANFIVGFKQIAFFSFQTALYAGLKDSDGSIVDTSTGLNGKQFIDCAVNENLQAPSAPFYLPRSVAPNGKPFEITMVDQPRGRVRMQRRNKKRDRLNFLISFATSCRFLTYFVVERPNGSHLPIKGFGWNYKQSIDLAWIDGKPKIQRNVGSVDNQGFLDNLRAGDSRFDMLANKDLRSADTLVTQFNQAMIAAQSGKISPNYEFSEFENYNDDVATEMKTHTVT